MGVYDNKPQTQGQPNEWFELSFQISIDAPVDWDNFDLRKWSHSIAKYTALAMVDTTDASEDFTETPLKTLIMHPTVSRVTLVNDEALHKIIDEFDDI